MSGNIVDFEELRRKKDPEPEGLYDESIDKEDFVIDLHQKDGLKSAVDELWSQVYIGKKVSELFADDDGKIHYKSRWVRSIETEPDYDRSLKEHLKITMDFINNNSLSTTFMKFYDEEIIKREVLKLLVLENKEKSPSNEDDPTSST